MEISDKSVKSITDFHARITVSEKESAQKKGKWKFD